MRSKRKQRIYRGGNGIYQSKEFVKDLTDRVGAHRQNGVAERAIRTISESARAMLLHAAMHWQEETTMDL
jgi:hypothetical protein